MLAPAGRWALLREIQTPLTNMEGEETIFFSVI